MTVVPEEEMPPGCFLLGSDIWTPMEKRLFKKAFCAHKKDFNLIHKTVRCTWQAGIDKVPSPCQGARAAGPVGATLCSCCERLTTLKSHH